MLIEFLDNDHPPQEMSQGGAKETGQEAVFSLETRKGLGKRSLQDTPTTLHTPNQNGENTVFAIPELD